MELKLLFKERRSVRAYRPSDVDVQVLKDAVSCAVMAPSWKNSETARYYFAVGEEKAKKVMALLPEFNQRSCQNVSAFLVTAFETGIAGFSAAGVQADSMGNGWGAYDLGHSNAYFLLALREAGYDSLIMGLRDEAGLRTLFGIPESQQIMGVIAIGKRAGEPVLRPRKDVAEISSFL